MLCITHITLEVKTLQLKTRPGHKQTGHITLHQSTEGTEQHKWYGVILDVMGMHKK